MEIDRPTLRRLMMNVSALASRASLAKRAGLQFGDDRDVFQTLGYKDEIRFRDYLSKYLRQDVAGAIVDKVSKTTWRRDPQVREVGIEDDTDFTSAVDEMADQTGLWAKLERADRLAGIRHYSVVLIGSTKGTDLTAPITEDGLGGPEDIGFFSVFREDHAEIKRFDGDPTSPRFGLPEEYELTLFGERADKPEGIDDTVRVDWSRVIHVVEDPVEDEVFGLPRLERVFNLLDDLMKIVGSSSEIYYKQVAGILWAQLREDFKATDDDLEDLEDDLQDALHELERLLMTGGLEDIGWVKPDQIPDPSAPFEVIKQLLAAATGIPQRILFGSERGELASSQDQASWFGLIAERQEQFAEPTVVRPLIDRLVDAGALPPPGSDGYEVVWPSLFELPETEKSEIRERNARAVKTIAEALLAGGDVAAELAAVLVPDVAEVLADDMTANRAFAAIEDAASAREVAALLANRVVEADGSGLFRVEGATATEPGEAVPLEGVDEEALDPASSDSFAIVRRRNGTAEAIVTTAALDTVIETATREVSAERDPELVVTVAEAAGLLDGSTVFRAVSDFRWEEE